MQTCAGGGGVSPLATQAEQHDEYGHHEGGGGCDGAQEKHLGDGGSGFARHGGHGLGGAESGGEGAEREDPTQPEGLLHTTCTDRGTSMCVVAKSISGVSP